MKVKVLHGGNTWPDTLGIGGIGRAAMNTAVAVCKEKSTDLSNDKHEGDILFVTTLQQVKIRIIYLTTNMMVIHNVSRHYNKSKIRIIYLTTNMRVIHCMSRHYNKSKIQIIYLTTNMMVIHNVSWHYDKSKIWIIDLTTNMMMIHCMLLHYDKSKYGLFI